MNTLPATTQRYHRWDGELSQGRSTWLIIVLTGIRLALRGTKTRALFMTIFAVVLGGCVILYLLSLMEVLAGTPEAQGLVDMVRGLLGLDISGVRQIGEFREILWRVLFLLIIKAEMLWVLVIVSRVGPGLIANDLKARALPIYFSKPVTPLTYLAGKWLVAAAFIAAVTVVPNLIILIVGTLVAGGLHTWGQTIGLAADLILSGLMMCVTAGAIVLALSSMSSDSRYVTVGWLAVCLLPAIAQGIVNDVLPAEATTGWLGCFSLRDNAIVLTDWLFSTRQSLEASSLPADAFTNAMVKPVNAGNAAAVLAACTLAAIAVSYRRVVKFSRSAANIG